MPSVTLNDRKVAGLKPQAKRVEATSIGHCQDSGCGCFPLA